MRPLVMTLCFLLSNVALASELSTTQVVEKTVKTEKAERHSCDDIHGELLDLQLELRRVVESNLSTFEDLVNVMDQWHGVLSGYEGRSVQFSYGYFRPIRESADTTAENCRFFANEFEDLMDRIRDLRDLAASCERLASN